MATHWNRPVPVISPETAPFWHACRERRFIIQKCRACGKFQYPYRGFCCHCWSQQIEDHTTPGLGTVWSFTVIERNYVPGFMELVPYVVALIELPEGIKVLSNVINCEPASVFIGMPVRVTFVDVDQDLRIPMFEPSSPIG